jgi:hypothetical protein
MLLHYARKYMREPDMVSIYYFVLSDTIDSGAEVESRNSCYGFFSGAAVGQTMTSLPRRADFYPQTILFSSHCAGRCGPA